MDKKDRLIVKLKDQQRACANHNDDTFVDNHMEAIEIPYGSSPDNDFMRNKKGLQEGLQSITRVEDIIKVLKEYFVACDTYEYSYTEENRSQPFLEDLNNEITAHKRYLEQNLTGECCNLFYNLIDKLQSRFHAAQNRGSQASICQAYDELALKYQELDKEVDEIYEKLKTEIRKETNAMHEEDNKSRIDAILNVGEDFDEPGFIKKYCQYKDGEPKVILESPEVISEYTNPNKDYSKFDVRKTLVLSTGHLPAAVAKLLDSQKDEVKRGVDDLSSFHGYTDFGYKFYTPEPNEKFDYFGSDVENILVFAKQELNCDYVEFDADGDLYEEFKQFDW